MDRISVIVATYNRKDMVKRLLESFGKLECSCPLEFIIIDDCSDDGTGSVVEDWKQTIGSADVKYKFLPTRSGPARARNAGISISTGNILAFTDSDCRVDPQWVENLYQWLIHHPGYVGAGGRVLPMDDDIFSQYNTIFRILEPQQNLKSIVGANFIVWKHPVMDVGMFDEYFYHPGGEETALCMKLGIRGYRFGFQQEGVVYHDYRKTLNAFIRTFLNYGTGEKIMIENRLSDYLQYMDYPEKMYNSVAFNHNLRFQVLFFFHMIVHILKQISFLRQMSLTNKRRIQLLGLGALQNFCNNLGRGTFSGIVVNSVNQYLRQNPGSLLILDPEEKTSQPLLEITDETVPELLKPGKSVKATVTIKNLSDHQWVSTSYLISAIHADSTFPFFQSEIQRDHLFSPNSESVYHFRFVSPKQEKDHIVHLFISSPLGMPISKKREKKITITSNRRYLDAEIMETAFPKEMVTGEHESVSIFIKNTGKIEWSEKNKIRLGSENDASGTGALFGDFRVTLPPDVRISPGSDACFAFRITAPHNPGRYLLRYRMVWENNSWFGKAIEQWVNVKEG